MTSSGNESLSKLISRLKNGIARKSSYVKTIKYPSLLVKSLQELNDVIGNDSVKDSVATQVTHLIMVKRRAMDDPNIKEDDVMLNTMLYGPPGVGKTSIATKLARIWYSLGYLNSGKTSNKVTSKIMSSVSDPDSIGVLAPLLPVILFGIIFVISFLWGGVKKVYNKFGAAYSILFVIVVILSLLILYNYLFTPTTTIIIDTKSDKTNKDKNSEEKVPVEDVIEEKLPLDADIVTITTRSDFVAQYVGHTAPKTKKLLTDNLGKVLFVDEAYSLINGPHDEFGMEALTELNQFMSENPGKIIIIFAGYQDLLYSGPLSVQPGLERRFMWKFDCNGYTTSELCDIFLLQLAKKGWNVRNKDRIRDLFSQNQDAFPSYGGDTERLGFFSELEHSRDFIADETDLLVSTLETYHVQRGLEKLRQNSIKPSENSTNPLANIMNLMSKRNNNSDTTKTDKEIFNSMKNKTFK